MLAPSEKKPIPILLYHSITDHAAPKFRHFAVSPALFAEHMTYLHQAGYTPLTVTQLVNACMREDAAGSHEHGQSLMPLEGVAEPCPYDRPVVITFDDGFADFYSAALPVLKHHGFTATLYVATAFLNGSSEWLWREGEAQRPMLTWEQLAEISACGIECGAHSHRHPQLDLLSEASAQEEIVGSKQILEDHLGKAVYSFAYPFGYYNAAVRQQVRAAGYTSACAVAYSMSSMTSDPFTLRRLMIGGCTSVETLAALLAGSRSQALTLMYLRARSTIWQLVRRGSAVVAGYPRGRLAAR